MTFEVEVAGEVRTVTIERAAGEAGAYRIRVAGRVYAVDVSRAGEFALSLLFQKVAGTFPGKVPATFVGAASVGSVEVGVTPTGGPGEVLVTIGGRVVTARIDGRRAGRRADGPGLAHGEQSVVAPMPGRVVRVLVNPGDEVAARQGVIVVEAMKMENELRSPKAGRVKDVSVTPGMSVDAGRILVVIE